MRKGWLLCGVATLALLMGAGTAGANEELIQMSKDPTQWIMQLGNYAGHRYSELDQINRDNVADLEVAWTFSTGVLRGHEGGPVVVGDVMYIHAPFPNTVYALDLNEPGRKIWEYEPTQDPSVIAIMCCDTVNRGVAYAPAQGGEPAKVFISLADTTLVALNAETGEELWTAKNGDPAKAESSTAAPVVVKDKVLVGISGAEYGVRGHLTAYDVDTGEMVWRAYSTGTDDEVLIDPETTTELGEPVEPDQGINTWEGDEWQIGGGTTWGWFTYDPELDLIYYGTGNPGTWNPNQRPGDNKYSMTVFARDPDDGMAKWLYQKTPHDEWDYDGVNENILTDLEIDGETRKVLVNFDRNGFAYTIDRETGELLVAEKYDPVVNWATHVDMETGRPQVVDEFSTAAQGEDFNVENICPAALGTKDQQPASFSPETGLFYVPTNHVCMSYEPFQVSYTAGQAYVGATVSMYPPEGEDHLGRFIAWDATKGEEVWAIEEPFSVWSGALATAGDIVFYGTLEGYLKAVDIETGEELFRFRTPSGIIGNINTYEHDGKQYVAVLSGIGGWAGIGLAAGLMAEDAAAGWHAAVHPERAEGAEVDTAGLGAVGAYKSLADYTSLGGVLTVFELPE
jgi:PQQ-dependent dehydrogenase (methanol/ethanol family)